MSDDKPPVEKAVELLVYAPVGMALYVRDMLPGMMGIFVARGKRELSGRGAPPPPVTPPPVPPEVKRRVEESLGLARVMAEGSIGVARDFAGSGFGVARDVAGTALGGIRTLRDTGGVPGRPAATEASAAPTAADATAAGASSAVPPDAGWRTDVPDVESLPIPDYDELSASQVVERLEGLDHDGLESIRQYESEHRGRNTILGKIAQLA